MAFSLGTRVGPYEIVAPLGAGGMGEVYRARDTRLQRDVAIKILPELFALDPDRRARFEREAQVLASLNHPHIAAIYGFEDTNSTGAIVMELVEGPTLADRVARGPVPLAETLAIAKQLVLALDAAHEKGIVHRDLKPANIKLTSDGAVKVLDFGLAKALDAGLPHAHAITDSPTISVAGTAAGIILGTAAYMSPEQARGQVVDKRADIWAFGCVVYELLSGRRAFDGATVSDTVAAILTRDPDWSAFPRETSDPVRRLVRRCLEKDPKQRLRDIGDAPAILDAPRPQAARRSAWPVLAAALVAAGAAGTLAVWWRDLAPASRGAAVANRTIATRLTDYGRSENEPALSPDGRSFVFVSDHGGTPDIWLRQVAGGEPIRLTNDAAAESDLAYAPDGETIYFTRATPEGPAIWQTGVLGGQPRLVVAGGRLVAPSPDGRRLAYVRPQSGTSDLHLRTVEGGDDRIVVRAVTGPVSHAWSRDNRRLSYLRAGLFAPSNLFVVDIHSGEERQVTRFTRGNEGVNDHAWLPDHRHIAVVYVPFPRQLPTSDLGILDVEDGSIERLTMTVGSSFTAPSVSADGTRLVATMTQNTREVWKIPASSREGPTRLLASRGDPMWTSTSRDASRLLFNSSTSGSRNLWLKALDDDSAPKQLTFVPGDAIAHSSLSPDGRRVVFASTAAGHSDIWVQNVDGTGLRQLTNDAAADSWPVWSPDGEWLVFSSLRSGQETWRIRLDGGQAEKLFDGFFRGDWSKQPSGAGTWIVTSNGTNAARLLDVERRSVVWEIRVPGAGLSLPIFSPDGRTFSMPYQIARDRDAIGIFDTASGAPRTTILLPFRVVFRANWIDRGQAFLVNRADTLSHVVLFDRFWTPPR
jgi:Tol biopolymer transport system component